MKSSRVLRANSMFSRDTESSIAHRRYRELPLTDRTLAEAIDDRSRG
jgi:hypothetical protein